MRILLIEPNFYENGAIRISLDRARRWSADNTVTVLPVAADMRGEPGQVELPAGVDIRYPTPTRQRFAVTVLAALRHGYAMARAADVIVSGREVDAGLLVAAMLAMVARRPLSVLVQSNVGAAIEEHVEPRMRGFTRWAFQRASQAVCVSKGLVESAVAAGLPTRSTHVVYNGVDHAAILAASQQAPENGLALPDGPVVIASGRLSRQKGFDLLIRAHAQVVARGQAHSLVILGEGDDRAALSALALELGVGRSVHLVGFVRNPHAFVVRSALFVLSSRWEGLPTTVLEALSLGIPVVASDCVSGPSDILQGGEFGALVPVENAEAIGNAISAYLTDPYDLKRRAAMGQANARERFDPAYAASEHLRCLRLLI